MNNVLHEYYSGKTRTKKKQYDHHKRNYELSILILTMYSLSSYG